MRAILCFCSTRTRFEIRIQSGGNDTLRGQAWSEQQARLKEALAPLEKKGVKVLPYTMEKQWT